MVSRKQFERQAMQVMQRLARNGGFLRNAKGSWELWSPRNGFRRPVMEVPSRVGDAMASCGWLRADGQGGWILADAGRSFLAARAPAAADAAARRRKDTRRREIVDPDGLRRHVEVRDESPLDWLARRKDRRGRPFLSPEEVAAGERLRRDYEMGRLNQKVTASWDAAFTASDRRRVRAAPRDGLNTSERAIAARQRLHAALAAVGPGLDDILLRVCCLSWGLEAAERELNWPRRSARLVLRIALERLAAHYGLKRRPRPAATRILGWGLPDHVPQHALPPDMEQ